MKTITLASGKKVLLIGFGFSLSDVAEAIRPTPKVNKFRAALPWILIAILAIGLAVSGYFNWSQHQEVLEWEQYCESLRDDYNEYLSQYEEGFKQYEEANDALRDQVNQLQADRTKLLDQLNKLADQLDEIRSQTADIYTQAQSLWYNLYYYDTAPDADDLDILTGDTRDLNDFLDEIIPELDNFIYNFGW